MRADRRLVAGQCKFKTRTQEHGHSCAEDNQKLHDFWCYCRLRGRRLACLPYGKINDGLDILEMAPHIQDLLMNCELWRLFLK